MFEETTLLRRNSRVVEYTAFMLWTTQFIQREGFMLTTEQDRFSSLVIYDKLVLIGL